MKLLSKIFMAAIFIVVTSHSFAGSLTIEKIDTLQNVDRHLSGFTGIKIAGPFEVHILQGTAESVKFEAPADLVDRIVTEVDGGVLEIHNKHDNWGWGDKSWWSDKSVWHNHKKIAVYITAKDLNFVSISGSGSAAFNEGIVTNSLKLRVTGSGSMQGKIEVKKLESLISGSGDMKLLGSAESSIVRIAGSGNFIARNLVTVTSVAHVSGSGKAEVNASNKVDAATSGSGVINYTGTAKIVTSSKSGSGEISRF